MQSSAPFEQSAQATSTATPGDLRRDASAYVDAWSALFAHETQVAQRSLVRLALAVLVVPAFVLTICVAFDAFIAALANRWLQDWTSGIALALLFDFVALYGLLRMMRAWWRNLSLPRSRHALTRLLGRLT